MNRASTIFATAAITSSSLLAQALSLPGPDGYVAVPHAGALVPQNGLTVEAWVRPSTLAGRPTIARKNPTAFNESYNLRIEFGRPQFTVQTANGFTTLWPSTSIAVGSTHHIAGTYDGATLRLFLDGALIGETAGAGGPLLDTGGDLRIGKGDDVASGENYFGEIDAVRIWDRPLREREIAGGLDRELPSGTGLIASWNFDNDLSDERGQHGGSAVASTAFAPEFAPAFATALDTMQGNGFVEVPHAPELVPATGLTIEAWIRLDSSAGRPTIVRKDPAPFAESYNFRVEFGSLQFIINTTAGFQTLWALGTSLPIGEPVHVAACYDGATMKLFVDGQLLASQPASGTFTPSTGPLRIGKGDDLGNEEFHGLIDSVRLWQVALADQDVAALAGLDVDAMPGLIGSWQFDGDLTDSASGRNGAAVGSTAFVDQAGPQIGVPATGLALFGSGTSSCAHAPTMTASQLPVIGNAGFAIGSAGGPSQGLWVHALTLARLPGAIPALGVAIWLDPTPPVASTFGFGTPLGTSRSALPLPPNPNVGGLQLFAQAFWFDPCGAQGMTSSQGLAITILP